MASYNPNQHLLPGFMYETDDVDQLPPHVDWTTSLGPVRNQDVYPTCFAFATSDVVASAHLIHEEEALRIFSPQELVDFEYYSVIDPRPGGYPDCCLDYVTHFGGLVEEYNYPYYGPIEIDPDFDYITGLLRFGGLAGYQRVPGNRISFMKALSHQPLLCAMAVNTEFMRYMGRNIFSGEIEEGEFFEWHNIVGAGYYWNQEVNNDGQVHYRLVYTFKNSWGSDWGFNGYIHIYADVAEQFGLLEEIYMPITHTQWANYLAAEHAAQHMAYAGQMPYYY